MDSFIVAVILVLFTQTEDKCKDIQKLEIEMYNIQYTDSVEISTMSEIAIGDDIKIWHYYCQDT